MNEELVKEFKENAIYRLDESTRMVTMTLEGLEEANVWKRPNKVSNSIGNLILHLCGNITQYAIASLGDLPDNRDRDSEFSQQEGYNKKELLEKLTSVIERAKQIISNSSGIELLRKREVQGFNFSGIGIIMHVVEHYSYHTGQIAFWVKQLQERDLGFYEGFDLSVKNK